MAAPILETILRRELANVSDVSELPKWADAKRTYAAWRLKHGFGNGAFALLLTPPAGQTKLEKSDIPTYGLTLAPAGMSGYNVCPWATLGCTSACVIATSGRTAMPTGKRGAISRTRFAAEHPGAFASLLWHEIASAVRRHNGDVAFRLNVGSDIRWERVLPALFDAFADVQFYDYTKAPVSRLRNVPANYDLTKSASEESDAAEIAEWCSAGARVAVVFDVPAKPSTSQALPLPSSWHGVTVTDGDTSDYRPADPNGAIVGLRAKGAGKRDTSGFVKSADGSRNAADHG